MCVSVRMLYREEYSVLRKRKFKRNRENYMMGTFVTCILHMVCTLNWEDKHILPENIYREERTWEF